MPDPLDDKNYYDLLQVRPNASGDEIRRAYRNLMQKSRQHPDLGGDSRSAALLNKAYATLTNPARRAEYDARIAILWHVARGARRMGNARAPAGSPPVQSLDPRRACPFCRAIHQGRTQHRSASCANCGSPLSTADKVRLEPSDQRAVERLCRRMDVAFFTHWRQSKGFGGQTEDISPNGLRLVTRTALRTGQHIRIVSDLVEAVGLVTHCVPRHGTWRTEYVAGISFVTLRFARSVGAFLSERA